MQGRFKMEYRLFTIVRYNYNYRDYNIVLPLCFVLPSPSPHTLSPSEPKPPLLERNIPSPVLVHTN